MQASPPLLCHHHHPGETFLLHHWCTHTYMYCMQLPTALPHTCWCNCTAHTQGSVCAHTINAQFSCTRAPSAWPPYLPTPSDALLGTPLTCWLKCWVCLDFTPLPPPPLFCLQSQYQREAGVDGFQTWIHEYLKKLDEKGYGIIHTFSTNVKIRFFLPHACLDHG